MEPPRVHRTEVDGVPTFWVDSSRPTLEASLYFRCGSVDETLPTSGWFHLLEHIVLHGTHGRDCEVNGEVDLTTTSFDVSAEPAVVAAHLAQITRRMHHVAAADLDHERRVLVQEMDEKSPDPWVSAALQVRYGPHGPGLAEHVGLWAATPERLSDLMRRAFVRQNAALCLSGPPPVGLTLELGDGVAWPTPPLPISAAPGPHSRANGHEVVTLSGVVRRGSAASVAANLIAADVVDDLRHGDGTSYSPRGDYVALTADQSLILVGAVVSDPRRAERVARSCLRAVETMAAAGPQAIDLEREVSARIRDSVDPMAAPSHAWRAAYLSLDGIPYDPAAEVAVLQALTPDRIRQVAAEMVGSTVLCLPEDPDDVAYPVPHISDSHPDVVPPSYTTRIAATDGTADELRLGPDGFAMTVGEMTLLFPYDQIDLVMTWADGRRTVVRQDGSVVRFDPALWKTPEPFRAALDAAVPEAKVVPGNPDEEWPQADPAVGAVNRVLAIATLVIMGIGVLLWIGAGVVRISRLTNVDAFPGWSSLGLLLAGVAVIGVGYGLGKVRERLFPDPAAQ